VWWTNRHWLWWNCASRWQRQQFGFVLDPAGNERRGVHLTLKVTGRVARGTPAIFSISTVQGFLSVRNLTFAGTISSHVLALNFNSGIGEVKATLNHGDLFIPVSGIPVVKGLFPGPTKSFMKVESDVRKSADHLELVHIANVVSEDLAAVESLSSRLATFGPYVLSVEPLMIQQDICPFPMYHRSRQLHSEIQLVGPVWIEPTTKEL
jgi:hypothetical protein